MSQLAQLVGVAPAQFRDAYFKHNHLANVQNMPWEDMVVSVVRTFDARPDAEEEARRLLKEHASKNFINTELVALFTALRKAGLKVAIFSNAGTWLRSFLEKEGIIPLVDEVVISAEVGHQKPHPEAFQVLFEKLGLLPSEVVFVDDAEKSLEKAREIGYIPLLFEDNDKLVVDLKNLGLHF